jgi:hypothetical protein
MPLSDDETDAAMLLSPVISSLRNFDSSFEVEVADVSSWCAPPSNDGEDESLTISTREEAFGQDLTSAEYECVCWAREGLWRRRIRDGCSSVINFFSASWLREIISLRKKKPVA